MSNNWKKTIRKEEVTKQTICMWMYIGNNTGAPWDLTVAEWYWSESLEKMVNGFKEVVIRDLINSYFLYDEEKYNQDKIQTRDLKMILEKAMKSEDGKEYKEVLEEIINHLECNPKSFDELNDLIMDVVELVNKMDIPLSITLVKGFSNCISLLKEHDQYNPELTGKEMLEKDIYC